MADSFGLKLGIDGEKDFKQALTDINKDFKVLGSEMKLVASQFDKNDNSIESLTARNEVLNKQIDAQKDKIKTLKSALENAANSFGENDKRTKNWQIQLNNAEAALNNMERELKDNTAQMNKTGTAADHMGDEIKQSGKQADDSRSGFDNLKGTLTKVGAALGTTVAAIGTAAVTAGKKIWDFANDTAEAGDEIDKQSQKLGLSSENYQKLSYAMERSGADVEDFKKGTANITKELANMQNGVEGAGSTFDQLGISVKNSDGSFKSTEDVFLSTIDALANMEDETQRNALANSIFGKSYQELAPLLNSGSDGIKELMDEAEKYGMVMSDDAVKASAAFEDSLTKLKGTLNGVKNALMSDLLPGFTSITDGFAELVSGNEEGAEMIKSGIESVIETVTDKIPDVVSLLTTVGEAILEEAPSVLESLSSNIIDLLPGALDFALNNVLPNLLESALNIAGQLFTSLSESLPDLMTSLAESFSTIVTELFSEDNITNFVDMLLTFIQNAIAGLSEALPIILEAIRTVVVNLNDALPDVLKMLLDMLPDLIDDISSLIKNGLPVLVQTAVDLISSICDNLPEILEQLFDSLPTILDSISSALIDNIDTLIQCGIDLTVGIVKNLPKIIVGLLKAAPSILKSLAKSLLSGLSSIVEVGKNIVQGLWNGITGAASWLWEKITGWLSSIWDGIKNFFGIKSPSTKMRDMIGKNLVKGLAQGITAEGQTAINAMTELSKEISSVTFSASAINFSSYQDDLKAAYQSLDSSSRSMYSDLVSQNIAAHEKVQKVFNNNISFGNVTINNDQDVETVAHKVSAIIAKDVMMKGGAYA